MKVILVNKYLYLRGGSERVLFITKQLLEEAGHQVEVFGMADERNLFSNQYLVPHIDYRTAKGFKKLRYLLSFIYNRAAKDAFGRLLDEFQPDIVHFHNIYHQLSFSLVDAVKERSIPSVMTLHDYKLISPNYNLFHHGRIDESGIKTQQFYRCLFSNCGEGFFNTLLLVLEAYVRKWRHYREDITYFVSPSEFLANKVHETGVARERLFVIPNPVTAVSTVVSYDQRKSYILYAGRLSSEKGVRYLIDAMATMPHIPLHIMGTGPEESQLKEIVHSKGLQQVTFLGHCSAEEVDQAMKACRLLIVPSVWYENCPMNILEAKTSGTVVIGTNLGGIPELLPSDLLVAPQDAEALSKAITLWYEASNQTLTTLGTSLAEGVQKRHTLEVYKTQLLSVYEKAIATIRTGDTIN